MLRSRLRAPAKSVVVTRATARSRCRLRWRARLRRPGQLLPLRTVGAPAGSSAVAAVDPASVEKEAAAALFQAQVVPDPNLVARPSPAPQRSELAASAADPASVLGPKTIDRPGAAAPLEAVTLGAEPPERVVPRIRQMARSSRWQRPALPHLPAR